MSIIFTTPFCVPTSTITVHIRDCSLYHVPGSRKIPVFLRLPGLYQAIVVDLRRSGAATALARYSASCASYHQGNTDANFQAACSISGHVMEERSIATNPLHVDHRE